MGGQVVQFPGAAARLARRAERLRTERPVSAEHEHYEQTLNVEAEVVSAAIRMVEHVEAHPEDHVRLPLVAQLLVEEAKHLRRLYDLDPTGGGATAEPPGPPAPPQRP